MVASKRPPTPCPAEQTPIWPSQHPSIGWRLLGLANFTKYRGSFEQMPSQQTQLNPNKQQHSATWHASMTKLAGVQDVGNTTTVSGNQVIIETGQLKFGIEMHCIEPLLGNSRPVDSENGGTVRLHLISTQNLVQIGGPFFSLNFGTQLFKPLAVHTSYIGLCTGGVFSWLFNVQQEREGPPIMVSLFFLSILHFWAGQTWIFVLMNFLMFRWVMITFCSKWF